MFPDRLDVPEVLLEPIDVPGTIDGERPVRRDRANPNPRRNLFTIQTIGDEPQAHRARPEPSAAAIGVGSVAPAQFRFVTARDEALAATRRIGFIPSTAPEPAVGVDADGRRTATERSQTTDRSLDLVWVCVVQSERTEPGFSGDPTDTVRGCHRDSRIAGAGSHPRGPIR